MSRRSKKINPRRRPCNAQDVARAKDKATDDGLRLALYIALYVMLDKFGFSDEQLSMASHAMNRTASMINSGELKWQEIMQIVKEEYGVEVCVE